VGDRRNEAISMSRRIDTRRTAVARQRRAGRDPSDRAEFSPGRPDGRSTACQVVVGCAGQGVVGVLS
jgi:hypothetical protein